MKMESSLRFKFSNEESFFNLFIALCVLFGIILIFFPKELFNFCVLLFVFILFLYLISLFWLNSFIFSEDKVLITYYTRFSKRKKNIYYSELIKIKYVHKLGKANIPLFIVNNDINFPFPSCSFTGSNQDKNKSFLKFINSKGIKVEINSDFEKDYNILNDPF